MVYTKSEHMAADVYTKAFTDVHRWRHACMLINILDPKLFQNKEFMESLRSSRSGGSSSESPVPNAGGTQKPPGGASVAKGVPPDDNNVAPVNLPRPGWHRAMGGGGTF